jgi:hypothetical protein
MTREEIRTVVLETIAEYQQQAHRLGYPEAEAAAAMGIPRHRLRDARLRNEVSARKVGKGYVYSTVALLRYLEA